MNTNNMKLSIEEFVRTGNFGPVQLGMSKQEVVGFLGSPDSDNNISKDGDILLYGWYELFINHENKLHSIQNDHYEPKYSESFEFRNEKIQIDSWFLNDTENQTVESISNLLQSKNINFNVIKYCGRDVIKTESGIIIDFHEEENKFGAKELLGFWYWT